MKRFIKRVGKYKIKSTRFDWIVVNCLTGTHAHFDTKWGCECIIHMLDEGIEPIDPHFIESKRRLTVQKEHKQHYINVNKGAR